MGKNRETAESYFNRIPDGHRNAMKRPANPVIDRRLRKMIEKENCNGDCIINVGYGIFRPIPSDPEDERALKEYLGTELSRARASLFKRRCMKQTFKSWKMAGEYNALHTNHKRETEQHE